MKWQPITLQLLWTFGSLNNVNESELIHTETLPWNVKLLGVRQKFNVKWILFEHVLLGYVITWMHECWICMYGSE